MQIGAQELAETYRQSSNDDLADLAAQIDTLTVAARVALQAEIQRRGLTPSQLRTLHAKELHREARFDHFEAVRRKKTLIFLLSRGDSMGWIWAALFVLGVAAFSWLRSKFR